MLLICADQAVTTKKKKKKSLEAQDFQLRTDQGGWLFVILGQSQCYINIIIIAALVAMTAILVDHNDEVKVLSEWVRARYGTWTPTVYTSVCCAHTQLNRFPQILGITCMTSCISPPHFSSSVCNIEKLWETARRRGYITATMRINNYLPHNIYPHCKAVVGEP